MTNATTSRDPRNAWLVAALMMVIAVFYLRWQGRVWWCACGQVKIISLNVVSSHNSQHLFDAYSLSHLLHGLIFFGVCWLLRNKWPTHWRWVAALSIEIAWELMENSPMIINRYRSATVSLGYQGDSIVNSTGDVLSYLAGYWLASNIKWWKSVILFIIIELAMLWLIRDNLALNVLMLLWPIDAVRKWQANG